LNIPALTIIEINESTGDWWIIATKQAAARLGSQMREKPRLLPSKSV
jgi:hypothetical protein